MQGIRCQENHWKSSRSRFKATPPKTIPDSSSRGAAPSETCPGNAIQIEAGIKTSLWLLSVALPRPLKHSGRWKMDAGRVCKKRKNRPHVS